MFRRALKISKFMYEASSCLSACTSACNSSAPCWTDFHQVLYLIIFGKSSVKIQVLLLKSNEINRNLT
jgi:hypothetical protein